MIVCDGPSVRLGILYSNFFICISLFVFIRICLFSLPYYFLFFSIFLGRLISRSFRGQFFTHCLFFILTHCCPHLYSLLRIFFICVFFFFFPHNHTFQSRSPWIFVFLVRQFQAVRPVPNRPLIVLFFFFILRTQSYLTDPIHHIHCIQ